MEHEQKLIDRFVKMLKDKKLVNGQMVNANCRCKKFADVEFTGIDNKYYIIEAKTHLSPDCNNGAHKVFGELMVENKRSYKRNKKSVLGLLISEEQSGENWYRRKFDRIDDSVFNEFGRLCNVEYIFIMGHDTCKAYKWFDFISGQKSSMIEKQITKRK